MESYFGVNAQPKSECKANLLGVWLFRGKLLIADKKLGGHQVALLFKNATDC